jgi:hypothetical protein
MVGGKSRHELLIRLAAALDSHPEFFGKEVCRPGNVVDYVLKHADKDGNVSIKVLWNAVISGYENIWPERLSGVRRGDVWTYTPLKKKGEPASDLVPFHKLSQWLTYSLLEPLETLLKIHFTETELLTGLAEYRNGGLFIDTEVLVPTNSVYSQMTHDAGSELIIEWRACTVSLPSSCSCPCNPI